MPIFQRETQLPFPAEAVFAWHERPGALERLTPPWQSVRVLERHGTIHDGDRVILELAIGPLKQHWVALHRDFEASRQFRDRQVSGPFAHWIHTHRFIPLGPATSRLQTMSTTTCPSASSAGSRPATRSRKCSIACSASDTTGRRTTSCVIRPTPGTRACASP